MPSAGCVAYSRRICLLILGQLAAETMTNDAMISSLQGRRVGRKKTDYSRVEIGYRSAYVRNALMLPFSVPASSVYEGDEGRERVG
jgi:hypothetical protein